jgi:hypothetical protein
VGQVPGKQLQFIAGRTSFPRFQIPGGISQAVPRKRELIGVQWQGIQNQLRFGKGVFVCVSRVCVPFEPHMQSFDALYGLQIEVFNREVLCDCRFCATGHGFSPDFVIRLRDQPTSID